MRKQRLQTIGVAGALPRIGVTTQALQMVKYFQIAGYRACYIEMNGSGYPEKVLQVYRKAKKKKNGMVEFSHVPLYGKEIWKEAAENYDFLVKDYGAVRDASFEKISFLEQDMRILLCGVKPDEVAASEWALETYGEKCDRFLFNFVCEEERKEIKKMMVERAEMTYFMEGIPNPFSYAAPSALVCQSLLLTER